MAFPKKTLGSSKYGAKKTAFLFHDELVEADSKKEAKFGEHLQAREKLGEISNLKYQVPYILINKSQYGREIKYIADFTYFENGKLVVCDVKSDFTRRQPVYRLKKRLMAERYQIVIKEVV